MINPIEFTDRFDLERQLKPGKPIFGIAKEKRGYYFSCVGLFYNENRYRPTFIVWLEGDTKYFVVNDSCYAFPVTTSPAKFVDYLFLVHPDTPSGFCSIPNGFKGKKNDLNPSRHRVSYHSFVERPRVSRNL